MNADTHDTPPVVGLAELARLRGVSVATVRRWIAGGKLPPPFRFRPNLHLWPADQVAGDTTTTTETVAHE